MKHILVILLFIFCLYANAQQWEKAKGFDYISAESPVLHVTDNQGNVYIAGELSEQGDYLEFHGVSLMTKGDMDIFVVKLDSNYNFLWVKTFGTPVKEMVSDIIIDNAGDIVIKGFFSNPLTLGKYTLQSLGGTDFFLAKLDNSGEVKWATSGGSEFDDDDEIHRVSLYADSNNNLFISGTFANNNDNNPKPTAWFDALSIRSYGESDIFIASYSGDGKIKWVKNFGSYSSDYCSIFLLNGFIYVCGSSGGIVFNYDSLNIKSQYGSGIAFIMKMDTLGSVQWVKFGVLTAWGTIGSHTITADSLGNVYLFGIYYCIDYNCRFKFEDYYLNEKDQHPFIIKLDKNGRIKWVKEEENTFTKVIPKNNNHYIILSGRTILEKDSNWVNIYSQQCGENASSIPTDISLIKNNRILVTGYYKDAPDFDSIQLPYVHRPSGLFIAQRNYIQKPVGINKKIEQELIVSPIPADKSITIKGLSETYNHSNITVYRSDGKTVISQEVIEYPLELNTSEWPAGLYVFRLNTDNNHFFKKVLIVH